LRSGVLVKRARRKAGNAINKRNAKAAKRKNRNQKTTETDRTAMLRSTPPDPRGTHSMSLGGGHELTADGTARTMTPNALA